MRKERNYDFRQRHWLYHRPGMRQAGRAVREHELEITSEWQIGCSPDEPGILHDAAKDFQDYLWSSMETAVKLTVQDGNKTLWINPQDSEFGIWENAGIPFKVFAEKFSAVKQLQK